MPYKNIYWIKLEKRLLNDYRYYTMSSDSKLIYIEFLMLAAETNNKIPKKVGVIKTALRSHLSEKQIESCIQEIKTNFPKFKENKGFYNFNEWSNRCNWIINKESRRKAEGIPREGANRVDKIRVDKIRIEYTKKKKIPEEEKELISFIYKRFGKTIKELLILAKGDPDKIIKAMNWFGDLCDKKGLNWNLNTILKWFPEYLISGQKIAEDELLQKFGLKKE